MIADDRRGITIDTGPGRFVAWAYAEVRTQRLAQRTQELLRSREIAAKVAERTRNALPPHAKGHVFEMMEALRFNLASIDAGATRRAVTSADLGQFTAPADILIRGSGGEVVREVQAKVYEHAPEGLRALAKDKYEGMGRLVPSDQTERVAALADSALARPPDSLNRSQYQDVANNLMGPLEHNGVRSEGTTNAELDQIGHRPDEWVEQSLAAAKRQEIARAAAAGAAFSGGFEFVFSAGHNAIRHQRGDIEGAKAVIDTVSATAVAAVRGGATCGVAKSIEIAARNSPEWQHFAAGIGPVAVANAVVEVATSGYQFATGAIDAAEFAEQCGTTVLSNSASWAYGVVGQTLIPVPVLGGLVGATVGYLSATVVMEGLKLSYIAAREADVAEEELARLESWIYDAIQRLEENRLVVESINEVHALRFRETLVPMMDDLEDCLASATDCLGQLDALCTEFNSSLPFATFEEFEEFMGDEDSTLRL